MSSNVIYDKQGKVLKVKQIISGDATAKNNAAAAVSTSGYGSILSDSIAGVTHAASEIVMSTEGAITPMSSTAIVGELAAVKHFNSSFDESTISKDFPFTETSTPGIVAKKIQEIDYDEDNQATWLKVVSGNHASSDYKSNLKVITSSSPSIIRNEGLMDEMYLPAGTSMTYHIETQYGTRCTASDAVSLGMNEYIATGTISTSNKLGSEYFNGPAIALTGISPSLTITKNQISSTDAIFFKASATGDYIFFIYVNGFYYNQIRYTITDTSKYVGFSYYYTSSDLSLCGVYMNANLTGTTTLPGYVSGYQLLNPADDAISPTAYGTSNKDTLYMHAVRCHATGNYTSLPVDDGYWQGNKVSTLQWFVPTIQNRLLPTTRTISVNLELDEYNLWNLPSWTGLWPITTIYVHAKKDSAIRQLKALLPIAGDKIVTEAYLQPTSTSPSSAYLQYPDNAKWNITISSATTTTVTYYLFLKLRHGWKMKSEYGWTLVSGTEFMDGAVWRKSVTLSSSCALNVEADEFYLGLTMMNVKFPVITLGGAYICTEQMNILPSGEASSYDSTGQYTTYSSGARTLLTYTDDFVVCPFAPCTLNIYTVVEVFNSVDGSSTSYTYETATIASLQPDYKPFTQSGDNYSSQFDTYDALDDTSHTKNGLSVTYVKK